MPNLILSVGNCAADHTYLTQVLESRFDVRITTASTAAEAMRSVADESFDLILVNRLLDSTGESGIDLIRQINQAKPDAQAMLVSNFADQQEMAGQAGAVQGFGKSALNRPETLDHLAKWLD